MTHCASCNGIITKTDEECYMCGEAVPGAPKGLRKWLKRLFATPATPEATLKVEP